MQGAAVAELLLAMGPHRSLKKPPGCDAADVSLFTSRLGHVYERQGRTDLTQKLLLEPYRIFRLGYIPLTLELAERLDWLVSEYLGLENMSATDELLSLIAQIQDAAQRGLSVPVNVSLSEP